MTDQVVDRKTWNSRLIVTIVGIAGVAALGIASVITGPVALGTIVSLVTGYTAYREATSPHRNPKSEIQNPQSDEGE